MGKVLSSGAEDLDFLYISWLGPPSKRTYFVQVDQIKILTVYIEVNSPSASNSDTNDNTNPQVSKPAFKIVVMVGLDVPRKISKSKLSPKKPKPNELV
jgi:hypothetical protein